MRSFYYIATTVAFIAMCSVTADNSRSTTFGVGSSTNNSICIPISSYVKSIEASSIASEEKKKTLPKPPKNRVCDKDFKIIIIDAKLSDLVLYARRVYRRI
ncbi:hypothetical protein AYI69_g8425 [Smittium culicis]|uniref:Uncharacterized protein n=1 Tax=Smittium culicis TaxID=133412 RepID=A0A1R1XJK7_9FUNG|nr:hypothetical protein AYI69_g8425 [Smittium culicis]